MTQFRLNRRVSRELLGKTDPRFNQVLIVREENTIPIVEAYKPTRKERKLLAVLFDPNYLDASVTEICKAADVSSETYYKALKKPGFVASIKAYAVDATKGKAPLYVSLAEKFAKEGSWAHLRALLAMSGVYDEKTIIQAEQVATVLQPKGDGE